MLPRLCATVLLACTPFNFGAAFFISNRLFCQATVVAPFHRLASTLLCRGGAEPTSFPPSLSTGFVDPSLPPVRLSSFGGRRLLPPPRWVSTPLVDFVFRLSLLLGWGLRRQCDFAFPSEGLRLLPPPRSESTTFVDSFLPAASAPPLSRRPPFDGLRLLPPPRSESTNFLVPLFSLEVARQTIHASEHGYSTQPEGWNFSSRFRLGAPTSADQALSLVERAGSHSGASPPI